MEMFLPATKNLLSEKNHGMCKHFVRMQLLACGGRMQTLSYFRFTHSHLVRAAGQLMSFFMVSFAEESGINESVINSGV